MDRCSRTRAVCACRLCTRIPWSEGWQDLQVSCMSWFPHCQVSRRDGMEAADIRMLAVGYASGKVWGRLDR